MPESLDQQLGLVGDLGGTAGIRRLRESRTKPVGSYRELNPALRSGGADKYGAELARAGITNNGLGGCAMRKKVQRRNRYSRRSASGQHLIELMVAVAVSGFLAVTMSTSLIQTIAVTTSAENKLKGSDIANELMERLRECQFSDLPTAGTFDVPVYSNDGVPFGPEKFQKAPLMMDTTSNYTWSDESENHSYLRGPGPNNYATASVTFGHGITATSTTVIIVVSWRDGTVNKSATVTSTISQAGVHN